MPFPPTPSQTPSNTPTPSVTPSITPSITPTLTECPSEFLITYGSYTSNACGLFPLTGYTSYIQYNSTNYLLNDVSIGFGDIQLGDCIPVLYPYVGLTYRFDFIPDPSLQLCSTATGYAFDRIDYEVISYDGTPIGFPQYTIDEKYYLNNVLVNVVPSIPITVIDQTTETCNVNIINLIPFFFVQIPVTPTPSATPTLTPTITPSPTNTPSITPSVTPTMTPSATISVECLCYYILNETGSAGNYSYTQCDGTFVSQSLAGGASVRVCSQDLPAVDPGLTVAPCTDITTCTQDSDCTGCSF